MIRTTHGALERLVEAARRLPGAGAEALRVPTEVEGPTDAPPAAELRRAVGALLATLAIRVEETLPAALERAKKAWDQVDAIVVLDRKLRRDARGLLAGAAALRASADPASRALGLEAALTLESALGLCELAERRMATLVRLRLEENADLLPGGRPFLDLGAALAEAAREWS